LRRTPSNNAIAAAVALSFHELIQIGQDPGRYPVLDATGVNLINEGGINIRVDRSKVYGFKLKNKSRVALYVYMYYFNSKTLSIGKRPLCFLHRPNSGNSVIL
jgi:hypothetical protein